MPEIIENNSNHKILVTEDEESVREIIKWALEENGFEVITAVNGKDALDKFKKHEFHLVLSDIKMPVMTGMELLKNIKNLDPDMPVIMVTAVSDVNIALDALKNGAYDYVTKPFNIEELLVAVKRALEKRELILKNLEYQEYLEKKVEEQTREIKNLYLNAIKSLVFALEAKDKYTEGHSKRVTFYACEIAKRMRLSALLIHKIHLAGLLHDIGKIGVRESILNKPGKLTPDEYRHIYDHPVVGAKILTPVLKDKDILNFIRHHHERYDGSGRPDKLLGEEIPLGARILAVADTFDAMTSDRPYRKALTVDFAIKEIKRCSGSQFDPVVVIHFLDFVEEKLEKIVYIKPVLSEIFPEIEKEEFLVENI